MMLLAGSLIGCQGGGQKKDEASVFTGAAGEVRLITLDPGHFHAALVQKSMYPQIDQEVHVFAPAGSDVTEHLARVEGYNSREDQPTSWKEVVYTGEDFLERMLDTKPGNLVVLAGNNARKTEYILKAVNAGLNVLADKPMVITPDRYPLLEEAFRVAAEKGVFLYDIMTERYEITTMLQRELSLVKEVFGELLPGTVEEPAITKESVHHFSKMVSGKPLRRPAWFFDTTQQGEGIVDVTTHLVDLIQWEAFPEVILKKEDVELLDARRWSTGMTLEQFSGVTGMEQFPGFLEGSVEDGVLKVFSNGAFNYKLKGIHARISVIWNYSAPAGTGDTHYSIMRGSRCNLVIRQGAEENYQPVLYIEPVEGEDPKAFETALQKVIDEKLGVSWPGVKLSSAGVNIWSLEIPAIYKVGHEAHFGQVMEKYLSFLVKGEMPAWEIPNMLVKYYTTTEALKLASEE
ncbi:MAG TPA: putative oxidoreductase C-terminal domain-containing protein [Prolixibacteraceae bacterium]|nr:putative oxidoreductase C-terminal domain-containing protein [Prolixibacteraceae bacterium]HOY52276.1 putative oxidoreductase C-terminal domain-containing protein [Prolixibacteraceae bacterium]HRV89695.1 putative oxidoreductase C-terminal domain-containing protein [Prolixibacteraceae bacterium]